MRGHLVSSEQWEAVEKGGDWYFGNGEHNMHQLDHFRLGADQVLDDHRRDVENRRVLRFAPHGYCAAQGISATIKGELTVAEITAWLNSDLPQPEGP